MLFQILNSNFKENAKLKRWEPTAIEEANMISMYEEGKTPNEMIPILGLEAVDLKEIQMKINNLDGRLRRLHDKDKCSCTSETPCSYQKRRKYH